jgi:hypothetical protein
VEGESSRGEKLQERKGAATGGNPKGSARTCREEEGSEAGEAGGTGRFRRTGSRGTGKRVTRSGSERGSTMLLRHAERKLEAVRGSRQLRESAGVGETAGDKASGGASRHAGG